MALPKLYYTSPRGQLAVMLLAALRDLYLNDGLRNVTKRQAIDFIGRQHWFALKDADPVPYPSQRFVTGEPRWNTFLARARKDPVLRDLISYDPRDPGAITRRGRDEFERFPNFCMTGF